MFSNTNLLTNDFTISVFNPIFALFTNENVVKIQIQSGVTSRCSYFKRKLTV